MFDRLKLLLENDFNSICDAHILLIGLGGVGGYVFEALVRSGVKYITIVDYDKVDKTNINRQIISNANNIFNYKVYEAKKRALEINKDICVKTILKKVDEDNALEIIKSDKFDYIIDACDDVRAKLLLITYTYDYNIPFISCMGTANRFKANMYEVVKLKNTYNDPLARKIRTSLDKKYLNTLVVWSRELPKKTAGLGTICPSPMGAGATLAGFVLEQLQKK